MDDVQTPLARWRKARGLTQRQAIGLLDVSLRIWRYWEAGEREPPPMLGLALAALDAGLAPCETRIADDVSQSDLPPARVTQSAASTQKNACQS